MEQQYPVLIVDDDAKLRDLLTQYLEGYGYVVSTLPSGEGIIDEVKNSSPSIVILDIMMPGKDGLEVLRELRPHSNVPVIMLTGRGEEIDRVVGLEMGADDYIAKPFPLRELLARIRAVLRRYDSGRSSGSPVKIPSPKKNIEFGDVVINRSARNMTLEKAPVHLTSTEFDLVEQLAMSMGSVVERNDLMENALGRGMDFDDYVLNVHMSNLRKKLGQHVSIKTIRGRGYLMATPQIGTV